MQIVVIGNKQQEEELISTGIAGDVQIDWLSDIPGADQFRGADAFIDLLFIPSRDRISALRNLLPKPVFINSVIYTLSETDAAFIRINAWPTFFASGLMEGTCMNEERKETANAVFKKLNKKIEWLPDKTGFVTPRVICMIINEAYFALQEGVSTKEEIDIAMKLGTAYPYGPFEWSKKIGLKNIAALLTELAKTGKRYIPCSLLLHESRS